MTMRVAKRRAPSLPPPFFPAIAISLCPTAQMISLRCAPVSPALGQLAVELCRSRTLGNRPPTPANPTPNPRPPLVGQLAMCGKTRLHIFLPLCSTLYNTIVSPRALPADHARATWMGAAPNHAFFPRLKQLLCCMVSRTRNSLDRRSKVHPFGLSLRSAAKESGQQALGLQRG